MIVYVERWITRCSLMIAALMLLASCGGGGSSPEEPPVQTMAIRVQVPSNTPSGDTIYLRTGMLFGVDEQEVAMTKVSSSPAVWQATVTAPEGTILRYRYSRNRDWSKEETYPLRLHAGGFHVREALMRKGGTVSDAIAQWEDLSLVSGSTGTLVGVVTGPTGTLMGIRVSAGPHQTTTGSSTGGTRGARG